MGMLSLMQMFQYYKKTSSSEIIQLINFLNTWVCLAPLQSQSIFSLMFTYVTLYFTVGPLDVELIGRKDPVSVGRLYEFRCQSVGARPPPHVTWWRGSIQLRENVTSRVSNNNNRDGFQVLNIKPKNSGFWVDVPSQNHGGQHNLNRFFLYFPSILFILW